MLIFSACLLRMVANNCEAPFYRSGGYPLDERRSYNNESHIGGFTNLYGVCTPYKFWRVSWHDLKFLWRWGLLAAYFLSPVRIRTTSSIEKMKIFSSSIFPVFEFWIIVFKHFLFACFLQQILLPQYINKKTISLSVP